MQEALEIMLAELESNRLEVTLVPSRRHDARDWDMVRVACSKNATWYRRFCERHLSSRIRNHKKADTRIKRANVERLLRRMIAGVKVWSKYAAELREIAQREAKKSA